MTLPVPNLDDRRFQDLVDEAKRTVQRRCPEWTDHNVSDPGVTLIETFAWMTDQVLYRLNRVPDRMYVKFLELIGVRLFPPTPARTRATFWLSTPAGEVMRIAVGTRVATIRTEHDDAVVMSTTEELPIIPCELRHVATQAADADERIDETAALEKGQEFACFQRPPTPGDAFLIGLSEAVPSCALQLRFRARIEGVGVDPKDPPLVWEAWGGEEWHRCEVDHDDTGGINRDGDVVLHVPRTHTASIIDERRAGWLRARVVPALEGQPEYSSSPNIAGLTAATIGGTVEVIHAEVVENELLGVSEGTPGQRFEVRRRPVLAGAGAAVLESSSADGWVPWEQVSDFASSGPQDRHFLLDAATGEVLTGPAVRQPDGSVVQYGAVPDKGEQLRMRQYSVGGGRSGNVARGTIRVLKSAIPYVARVENRVAAQGGVDGEDIENAKLRGPISLRTRGRAVTAEDFEHLTREAAPEVARVRCVAAGEGVDAGSVRVLVVPAAGSEPQLRFEQLVPAEETLERIAARLDQCRLVGTRVLVEPPLYRGVTVVARLVSRPRVSASRLEQDALEALFRYLHPIVGGPDGTGWPFGRPVQSGEIFAVLQGLTGTEMVEDVRIFGADPISGERGGATTRLELEPYALVFSYRHQVRVDV